MLTRWLLAILVLLLVSGNAAAQSNNAAPSYRQGLALLGEPPFAGKNEGLLKDEDRTFLRGLRGPVLSQADRQRVEILMLRIQPAVELVLEGSRARKCDWELPRSEGLDMPLTHLSAMRTAGVLLNAQALAAITDGERGSIVEHMGALGRLSAHAAQDRNCFSALVGSAVGRLLTNTANDAIEGGLIDQPHATQLLEALGPLKSSDPYRYGEAMRGEYELLQQTAAGPEGADRIRSMLREQTALNDAELDRLCAPESLTGTLRQAGEVYRRAADALEDPDPDVARQQIQQITRMVESGRAGPLLPHLMPALDKILDAKLRTETELAQLLTRLQVIAEGKQTPEELQNAALFLARAAAEARSLPEETQEAFELMRVAPEALDEPARRRAEDLLRRARPAILGPLTTAASLRRCNFSVLRMPEPSLDVRLLSGLRGATRAVLADGLAQARAQGNADACVPALVAAFRAAALLSGDPTLARSHVAQSIWSEATAALQQALQAGPCSTEAREKLEQALGSMPAADPFGWRKAYTADLERLPEQTRKWQSGATPEALNARRRILRQRGASSLLARVALHDAVWSGTDTLPDPDAPALVRLNDLWLPEPLATLRRKAEEMREQPLTSMHLLDVAYDLPIEEQRARYRKLDPVRGVVLVEVQALQGEGAALFVRPFDLLKAPAPMVPATEDPALLDPALADPEEASAGDETDASADVPASGSPRDHAPADAVTP